jgi:hypothetical protein
VLIGEYSGDDVHGNMEEISGEVELDDYLATLGNATQLCFGPYPGLR